MWLCVSYGGVLLFVMFICNVSMCWLVLFFLLSWVSVVGSYLDVGVLVVKGIVSMFIIDLYLIMVVVLIMVVIGDMGLFEWLLFVVVFCL